MASKNKINKTVLVKGAFINDSKNFKSQAKIMKYLNNVKKSQKQLIKLELESIGYSITSQGNLKPIGVKYNNKLHSGITLKSLGISEKPLKVTIVDGPED